MDNGLLGGVGSFFGDKCTILFFILVFLLLFWNCGIGGVSGKC